MNVVFKNVSKRYGDELVLDKVSFSVEQGEFVTFVGHSGAGKTTIFNIILDGTEPTKGKVLYQGHDIRDFTQRELQDYRLSIGVIFQNFRLLSNRTVYENVAFAMEAFGFDDDRIERDVPYVLDLVDMEDKADFFPSDLSGGEQQRVAIARSIVKKPDILIADEPTGNLDPVNTHEVIHILKQINELGTTVLLATHDRGVVEKVRSRVITISEGALVKDDPSGKYIL